MSILFLLVPIAFVFTGFFVFIFIWAVRNNQFDDLTTPAYRILIQSDEPTLSKVNREGKEIEP